jgi:hypothetical protein
VSVTTYSTMRPNEWPFAEPERALRVNVEQIAALEGAKSRVLSAIVGASARAVAATAAASARTPDSKSALRTKVVLIIVPLSRSDP